MTTAVTSLSLNACATSEVTCTSGKRLRAVSRRFASASTIHLTWLVVPLWKLRIRFGPQCPAPTTAILIIARAVHHRARVQQRMQCVVLAGGLATRMRPKTDEVPKVLLEVEGRPFLHYALRLMAEQGVTEVVLALGHLAEL